LLERLRDLQELPWVLPLDQFFEAWVETVVGKLLSKAGIVVRSGRQRETVVA